MAKKTTGEKSTTGKKAGGKKSTTNASSKISTKSSSSKKGGGGGTGKSKSKSKTGEQKRKSGGGGSGSGGGGPKSYKKLHHSIKMPSSVAPTSSPKSKMEGSATSEKSKSGKKAAKKSMSTVEQGAIKGATTITTSDKSALIMVKSSKVELLETASSSKPTEVQSTAVVQPVPSSKLCSDIEPGGKKSSAVKLVSSKPSSNLGQAAVPSTLNPPKPKTKTAPKPAGAGVKSMVVKSSCGVKTSASTAAAAPPTSIALANDDGSIFNSSVQNDDSALALVMHTAHDEGPVKRDETEIFVPGKGELRSTQPEPPQ